MCLLHNSILRGYNSIYLQAPLVPDAEKASFVGYALTWHKFVKSHHDDEEATLFTKVEELLGDRDIWAETHKEHGKIRSKTPPLKAAARPGYGYILTEAHAEAFLTGLEEYHKYLSSLPSPSDFSGTELRRIMSTFQEPFVDHFHAEIATISALADHPNAPKEGTEEAKAASATFKSWGKSTVTKAGVTDVVPFFLLNLDRGIEAGMWANWPPMPAPVKWGLINIAGSLHSSWWKFASCDARGNKRELFALQFADAQH